MIFSQLNELDETILQHVEWMLIQDSQGLDIFLNLGQPDLLELVVTKFSESTQRKVEYVALSRETTESDLKQRREIQNGTTICFDQSLVRAAIHGHILVIKGIDKAEGNVLNVLRNLINKRKMQLEDGRILLPG